MTDTKPKTPEKSAAAPAAAKPAAAKPATKTSKIKSSSKARNYDIGNGVYRFSRTRMFHKKAIYKFLGKKTPKKVINCVYHLI